MEDNTTTTKRASYRKSLGIFELVGFGLGGTIGSGIFIVPGIAASIAGPSSIIAWIFACASASAIMYALAKTSSKYPSTGAFYSIFSQVFSKRISILLVLMYLVSSIFGIAAIASGIGQYVSSLAFDDFRNSSTDNSHIADSKGRSTTTTMSIIMILFVVEILAIAAFCIINIKRSTKDSL